MSEEFQYKISVQSVNWQTKSESAYMLVDNNKILNRDTPGISNSSNLSILTHSSSVGEKKEKAKKKQ